MSASRVPIVPYNKFDKTKLRIGRVNQQTTKDDTGKEITFWKFPIKYSLTGTDGKERLVDLHVRLKPMNTYGICVNTDAKKGTQNSSVPIYLDKERDHDVEVCFDQIWEAIAEWIVQPENRSQMESCLGADKAALLNTSQMVRLVMQSIVKDAKGQDKKPDKSKPRRIYAKNYESYDKNTKILSIQTPFYDFEKYNSATNKFEDDALIPHAYLLAKRLQMVPTIHVKEVYFNGTTSSILTNGSNYVVIKETAVESADVDTEYMAALSREGVVGETSALRKAPAPQPAAAPQPADPMQNIMNGSDNTSVPDSAETKNPAELL